MILPKTLLTLAAIAGFSAAAKADLTYTFDSGAEGFQNVTWSPLGYIQQTHTAGGWQSLQTKEFSWENGQQAEMQRLANLGNARLSFDLRVDGSSFPAGKATWYSAAMIGNSDGVGGWTQIDNIFTASGWHNADDSTVLSTHVDVPFSALGWNPGDTWFQVLTVANSDGAVPVNFILDNVSAYSVPEPTVTSLMGISVLLLALRRKRA